MTTKPPQKLKIEKGASTTFETPSFTHCFNKCHADIRRTINVKIINSDIFIEGDTLLKSTLDLKNFLAINSKINPAEKRKFTITHINSTKGKRKNIHPFLKTKVKISKCAMVITNRIAFNNNLPLFHQRTTSSFDAILFLLKIFFKYDFTYKPFCFG
ncbi:MAG: hypothetical protein ACO1NW_00350 [Chitinophagaceae bacterium]